MKFLAARKLLITDNPENRTDADNGTLSFVERAMKRRRLSISNSKARYIDTRFIVPHSNMCERFFSKAGYTFSDRRKLMLPANLEEQLFLHTNSRFWGIDDVNHVVTNE